MIVFICESGFGFPNGTSPTKRVQLYTQGLVQARKEAFILLLGASENRAKVLNHEVKGELNGVRFEYACGTTLRGTSFFQKRWLNIKGIWVTTRRLFQLKSQKKLEAIIIWESAFPWTDLWFWWMSRLLKCPVLRERNEHPFFDEGKSAGKTYQAVYSRLVLGQVDGVIVISKYLQDYFSKVIRPGGKMVKIPILVDVDTFDKVETAPSSIRWITYTGLLNEQKDGVLTLMKAFKEIYQEFPDVNLRLVGDNKISTKIPEFRSRAEEMGIADRIDFTGMVSLDKIPVYLKEASVLALARPSSLQAQAGFPSKVGEYLASGRPIVLTRTGELSDYLRDGVEVYFTEPDNYQAFAERLRYVLSHPEEGRTVGLRGQAVAREHFDYRANMQKLAKFIDSFSFRVSGENISVGKTNQ